MKTKKSFKEYAKKLLEAGAPIDPTAPQPLPLEMQNISLDMKVDSYIMKYEKESLPTQQAYAVPGTDLGMNFENKFKRTAARMLKEAEGDDPAAGGDDPLADSGADPDAGGDGGESAGGPPPAPSVENPRFNVANMAQSVARLVLNYEGLLDPRTTILNRARAYVEKNYSGGVAQQMMKILQTQFQLSPRDTQEQSGISQPVAAGAWTGVGGGGG